MLAFKHRWLKKNITYLSRILFYSMEGPRPIPICQSSLKIHLYYYFPHHNSQGSWITSQCYYRDTSMLTRPQALCTFNVHLYRINPLYTMYSLSFPTVPIDIKPKWLDIQFHVTTHHPPCVYQVQPSTPLMCLSPALTNSTLHFSAVSCYSHQYQAS